MLKSTKSDCPDPQAFAQRLARLRNRSRDRSVASHHSSDLASHRRHRPELPEKKSKGKTSAVFNWEFIQSPNLPYQILGRWRSITTSYVDVRREGLASTIQIEILPYLTSSFPTDIKLRLGPSCPTSLSYRIPSGYDIHSSPWLKHQAIFIGKPSMSMTFPIHGVYIYIYNIYIYVIYGWWCNNHLEKYKFVNVMMTFPMEK